MRAAPRLRTMEAAGRAALGGGGERGSGAGEENRPPALAARRVAGPRHRPALHRTAAPAPSRLARLRIARLQLPGPQHVTKASAESGGGGGMGCRT